MRFLGFGECGEKLFLERVHNRFKARLQYKLQTLTKVGDNHVSRN